MTSPYLDRPRRSLEEVLRARGGVGEFRAPRYRVKVAFRNAAIWLGPVEGLIEARGRASIEATRVKGTVTIEPCDRRAARDMLPGECWAFREHRTMAQVVGLES